ncbi:hypothetical protein [Deinococcus rubellus]|uniref:hypothetical protein n=1 Tax=Deinococcus rubellus TaxID=1889240 RepID=UPI003CD0AD57
MATEVELDKAPPTTEVQLMMEFLQDGNRHQFGVTGFFVGLPNFGRHLWVEPLLEDVQRL